MVFVDEGSEGECGCAVRTMGVKVAGAVICGVEVVEVDDEEEAVDCASTIHMRWERVATSLATV